MFEGMSNLMGLMKNVGKIKEEMANLQGRLGKIEADGDAGAGMVKARANGVMEIVKLTISDEALKDRELLEDLVAGACNQALKAAKAKVAEETQKMAAGLGLPAGMSLPGLS